MGGRRNTSSGSGSSSSSGEEDGDADWRAAIDSVASATDTSRTTTDGIASTSNGSTKNGEVTSTKPQNIKHYQIKAQKLLDDILEKNIEIVSDAIHIPEADPVINEGGVRLFKHAPSGIVFDHIVELQGPTKKPRIRPGKEIDENSKKFRWQLQSIAVDGMDVIAAARDAHQKSLARLEAKDAAAKAAAKREEERIAELKKIRGERWLPSISRNMRVKSHGW